MGPTQAHRAYTLGVGLPGPGLGGLVPEPRCKFKCHRGRTGTCSTNNEISNLHWSPLPPPRRRPRKDLKRPETRTNPAAEENERLLRPMQGTAGKNTLTSCSEPLPTPIQLRPPGRMVAASTNLNCMALATQPSGPSAKVQKVQTRSESFSIQLMNSSGRRPYA